VGYSCWVITDSDTVLDINKDSPEIVGYGLLSMAANEAHILNLCIKPERQHQGLGKSLMHHLIGQAKLLNAKSVYLEVRLSNQIAYDLYIKLGFTVIGNRKDYYPATNGREDAIVLQRLV
jgi:ribosomal-protein-alanine N-acetyltransferase